MSNMNLKVQEWKCYVLFVVLLFLLSTCIKSLKPGIWKVRNCIWMEQFSEKYHIILIRILWLIVLWKYGAHLWRRKTPQFYSEAQTKLKYAMWCSFWYLWAKYKIKFWLKCSVAEYLHKMHRIYHNNTSCLYISQ